jgi:hypothetical protein
MPASRGKADIVQDRPQIRFLPKPVDFSFDAIVELKHRRYWTDASQAVRIVLSWCGARAMNFSQMKDERILTFYENVRRQVEIDKQAGGRYRFAGEGGETIRGETSRRDGPAPAAIQPD